MTSSPTFRYQPPGTGARFSTREELYGSEYSARGAGNRGTAGATGLLTTKDELADLGLTNEVFAGFDRQFDEAQARAREMGETGPSDNGASRHVSAPTLNTLKFITPPPSV